MIGDSACIIGLGLIGGSLARDLTAAGMRVHAFDPDERSIEEAESQGAIEGGVRDLEEAGDHEVIVIATPVREVPPILRQLAAASAAASLITDAGSTKAGIVAAARESGLGDRFIGSHPLAGDERSGWAAARPGLFQLATVFLCPTPSTGPHVIARAEALWRLVGARPQIMDAEAHDRHVAWVSHLPQVLASALAGLLSERGFSAADLGRGGRDMTRLAGSDERMWIDILLTNRQHLSTALNDTARVIDSVRLAVESGDESAIRQLLEAGRRMRGD